MGPLPLKLAWTFHSLLQAHTQLTTVLTFLISQAQFHSKLIFLIMMYFFI